MPVEAGRMPSETKPWLKFYSEEALKDEMPKCTAYQYIKRANENFPDQIALNYYGKKISFRELFDRIENAQTHFMLWA